MEDYEDENLKLRNVQIAFLDEMVLRLRDMNHLHKSSTEIESTVEEMELVLTVDEQHVHGLEEFGGKFVLMFKSAIEEESFDEGNFGQSLGEQDDKLRLTFNLKSECVHKSELII